jgi:amylosucrase
MHDLERIRREAKRSLDRLLPRVSQEFFAAYGANADWYVFEQRLRHEWPRLFELLLSLYGTQYDFFYHLEQLLLMMARSWYERPSWLKQRDSLRESDAEWFQSERMMGGVLYVDRFCGTLSRLREFIPYFKELGLTYLHLMPLFAAPEGNNDGGYAVSSYRHVNPRLGTTAELAELAYDLDRAGISLVLDFVFNHTSDEHEWARRAQTGDPDYQEFYFLFPDRTMPDAYERTLREIFPTVRRGSFTWRADMQRWVWTTFNSFQWDLNYANPAVFRAMAAEMLFLANLGVAVLRLDAVPFIWKRMGTNCENQPEAHWIIQAFNAIARVAAPSLLFKSEAIVHPDDVLSYISPDECQLSYNPLLMALLWETLATREVKLLAHSLSHRFRLPPGCAWINYLRSHDDIGWTFDDNDARAVGIDPTGHRQFLNAFYTGRFPGSFARGLPFQENPDTGDARVSGTLASLAGLEQALESAEPQAIEIAIHRIILLHSVILSIGGIPLIYLGDEVGTLNDYSYINDPAKAIDSRWVHRPLRNQSAMNQRHDPTTVPGRIFSALTYLIHLRTSLPALRDGTMEIVRSDNRHVLAYVRQTGSQRVLVLVNFSEYPQTIAGNLLRMYGPGPELFDLVHEQVVTTSTDLTLHPYQFVWLTPRWPTAHRSR